jgi:molybdopterin-guanine dinucleotide biosynthesis protein B
VAEATRIISVIGRKDAGKTTLVVALASEFTRQKKKVGTIKQGHHPAVLDTEGTDTWRHYNEGLARRTLLDGPGQRVMFERTESHGDPQSLARLYMSDMDIVLVEGFEDTDLPKIEVHRSTLHPAPLYDARASHAGLWTAIVTDDRELRADITVFRFTDTAWLVTLSHVVWNGAKVLGA